VTVEELLNATESMTRPGAPVPPRQVRRQTPDLLRLVKSRDVV
jgi:hypothetical protein